MKRFVFGLATCAIALASCSTNDVLEQGSGSNNPNVINFSATTTRASVNNLGSLKDQTKGGFPVYAVTTKDDKGEAAVAWAIENKTYKFEGNTWKWFAADGSALDKGPQWPALAMFPMNFYAYYPAARDGNSDAEYAPAPTKTDDVVNVNTLEATITIGSTAAKQEDYLAANSTGITRPMATVPLAFKHITTKINFGVIAAAGTKSYVQQMNINNVKNTGKYNYVATGDGDPVVKHWTSTAFTAPKPAYNYYGTITPEAAGGSAKATKEFSCATNGTEGAASFFDASSEPIAAAAHLMLLPQKYTQVWTPEKYSGSQTATSGNQTNSSDNTPAGLTITPLKAYIGSVYRMTDGVENNEKDLVGFTNASNHPNFKDLSAEKQAVLNGKPLFVKVGFPLATGDNPVFSWTMGKAYTYNIALGQLDSSGGYILDDRYYDEKGNPTDLTIDGKDPGDPVLKGEIHFHVTVGEWTDGQGDDNTEGSGQEIQ